MAVISSLGEFELIEQLTKRRNESIPPGIIGPGDDCAVIPLSALGFSAEKNQSLLITVDTLVENVHFDLSLSAPADIGWKLAAVNISDIAAMGGTPKFAVISLQLRNDTTTEWVEELYRGMNELFERYGVFLLGGDTVSGNELSLSLTMCGQTSYPPILRSGAKSRDDIWLSGSIGGATAGLKLLREKRTQPKLPILRHCRPNPQLALGKLLAEQNLATAMIDISDGLIADASHIAERSNVSLTINLPDVPFDPEAAAILSAAELLVGGDDYELLFTASPAHRQAIQNISSVTRVGIVEQQTGAPGVNILDESGVIRLAHDYLIANGVKSAGGYRHF